MSEYGVGWVVTARLAVVVVGMTMYWIGGRNVKVIRRFCAPFFTSVLVGIVGNWWSGVVCYVLLCGSYHLGYGENSQLVKKVGKTGARVACGIAYAMAGIFLGIVNQAWVLLAFHLLSVPFATLAGMQMIRIKGEPLKAAEEEAAIAMYTQLLVPWMV